MMLINYFGWCPKCESDEISLNTDDFVGSKEGDIVVAVCKGCNHKFSVEVCSIHIEAANSKKED